VSGHIVQHIALRAATGVTALCTVLIIATMHTINSKAPDLLFWGPSWSFMENWNQLKAAGQTL